MEQIIKNANIVTASDIWKGDILIREGLIAALGRDLDTGDRRVIDANGLFALPGGIDPHTHLDMPFGGTVTADDFFTGHKGAAFGGTTTHVDFALQAKGQTLTQGVRTWQERALPKAAIDYGFHIAVTDPTEATIDEIPELKKIGVTSLKLFQQYKGVFMVDDTGLYQAMRKAAEHDMLIMTHCENGDVTDQLTKELLAAGKTAPEYHLTAHPDWIEGESTARAIAIAAVTGCKLYIVHMSCRASVEQLFLARQKGLAVMGETCTQYMFKFEEDMRVPGFEGAKWACSPPLRTPQDAEYIWQALKNTTLQIVGTDHCSFNFEGGKNGKNPGKELGKNGFHQIPNGIPGIEDRLMVMHHHGVNGRRFDLNRFVALTSTNVAKSMGLYPRKGALAAGSDADIVLWDMSREKTISAASHHMNVDYNAFEGMKVKGLPVRTILRGQTIVDNDQWLGKAGQGQYLERQAPIIL